MQPTPTTRDRHTLRWVLGVGLVFVVVSAMALQMARRQADERWVSVVAHWDESLQRDAGWGRVLEGFPFGYALARFGGQTETLGGNVFRAWRQSRWECQWFTLVLRQERSLFGSNTEGRMSGGVLEPSGVHITAGVHMTMNFGVAERTPALVDAIRTLFAEVDVELVVEP